MYWSVVEQVIDLHTECSRDIGREPHGSRRVVLQYIFYSMVRQAVSQSKALYIIKEDKEALERHAFI